MKRKNLLKAIMLITSQLLKTDITLARSEALRNCWKLYNDLKIKFGMEIAIKRLLVISECRTKKSTTVEKISNVKITQQNVCNIIEKHLKSKILNHFNYKGFSKEDAKDMLQEVHIRIFTNFDKFNSLNSKNTNELKSLQSFVYKTCENLMGNLRDKNSKLYKQRLSTISIDTLHNDTDDYFNTVYDVQSEEDINLNLEDKELSIAINKIISGIKNDNIRRIIPMWMQDYSEKDIANELQISIEKVKNSISRGKKIISDIMVTKDIFKVI